MKFTPNPKNPKIDSGVMDVTDWPTHATARHAASSLAPAHSCLGLAGGGEGGPDPPPPYSASRYRIATR